jgi:acetaldehyde dehydrogenase
MVAKVAAYVPGYRLKQVQFDRIPRPPPTIQLQAHGLKVTIFRSEGGALPAVLRGNLDIMTSAALVTAEQLAVTKLVWRPN